MLEKFPVAVLDFRKEHLEHCKKYQATYRSHIFYGGLKNDKQSLGDQMFLDTVIVFKIFLMPSGLINDFFPWGISFLTSATLNCKYIRNLFP